MIVRAVAILEHELIDRLGAVVELVDQRLAEMILERPLRLARARDADAAASAGRSGCRWRRRTGNTTRPCSTIDGAHIARRAHVTSAASSIRCVLRPRHQVRRRERVEEHLLVVRRRVGRDRSSTRAVEHVRFGIGIPAGDDRIAGPRNERGDRVPGRHYRRRASTKRAECERPPFHGHDATIAPCWD